MKLLIGSQKQVLSIVESNPQEYKDAIFIRITSEGFNDLPFTTDREYLFDFPDMEEQEYLDNLDKLIEYKNKVEEVFDKEIRINPITEEEAQEIREIAERIKQEGIQKVVIHCDEGKCRSPSVAYAICLLLGERETAEMIKSSNYYRLSQTIIEKIVEVNNQFKNNVRRF